ncbi:MAG: SAM-dependent methyltransferase [Lachnospiraceae bacterium]|nr:SAM-dependent methyltransferase [Lachnospiraceae bacterium]
MFDFLKEYIRNPRSVGAVAPSSKVLARKMVKAVDFENARCIVEYGPGTGSFTRQILSRKKEETMLCLIEQNETFYYKLRTLYGARRDIVVIHGSAEDADTLIRARGVSHADYVISGLPFTSLPQEVTYRIFKATRRIIGRNGLFITFQYSNVRRAFFEHYFVFEKVYLALRNIPPARVYVMRNREKPEGKA